MAVQESIVTSPTLQLSKDSEKADALERDRVNNAPEIDTAALAPEFFYESGLETVPEDVLPEAVAKHVEKEVVVYRARVGARLFDSLGSIRRRWVVALLILSGIIAVAVGVGLGVGRRPGGNPTLPETSGSPLASPISPPSSVHAALKHGILNDSSFAAVSAADASRYLFFQDTNGTLRYALYSQTTNLWTVDQTLVIPFTDNARNLTPLSATYETNEDEADQIFLFYLSKDNVLACACLNHGTWIDPKHTNLGYNFSTLENSRTLSVSRILGSNASEILLFYEPADGSVVALRGRSSSDSLFIGTSGVQTSVLWTLNNITAQLEQALRSADPLIRTREITGPFSTISTFPNATDMIFFSPVARNTQNSTYTPALIRTIYHADEGLFIGPTAEECSYLCQDWSCVEDGDIVTPQIPEGPDSNPTMWGVVYVNGSKLYCSLGFVEPLDSLFPYKRLATTTPNSSEVLYIYHQINETMFAQELYENSRNGWTSTNISVWSG